MFGKSKNKNLLIIGAGGHGKVVADIAEKMGCYDNIVFADDDENIKECMGYPVFLRKELGNHVYEQYDVFVAVGNSITRKKIIQDLQEKDCFFPILVHPSAVIARTVTVGEGTVVMAGTVINPDAQIGKSCIINTASTIDHECLIEDFCHISVGAHLAGTVEIGAHTWIGAGACVNNNVTIAPGCMIGAGAVVIKTIENAGVYVGIPARQKNS